MDNPKSFMIYKIFWSLLGHHQAYDMRWMKKKVHLMIQTVKYQDMTEENHSGESNTHSSEFPQYFLKKKKSHFWKRHKNMKNLPNRWLYDFYGVIRFFREHIGVNFKSVQGLIGKSRQFSIGC